MKRLLFTALLLPIALTAASKSLEIKVEGVRNDRGNVLVMIHTPASEEPFYARAEAREGSVTIPVEGIDADRAEISLFHDEDGDYQMKMGDRGPVEGYATKKCKLAGERTAVTVKLYYPVEEN